MTFTITMELVSLLITLLLVLFHFDLRNRNKQYYLFSLCLLLSGTTIVLDILTSLTINGALQLTYHLNYTLNMLYFCFLFLSFSVMVIYCFYLMFEHVADKHCYNIATRLVKLFALILLFMLCTNPWTDWFFHFEYGAYTRGRFNRLGYLFLLIEICMICAC